MKDLILHLDNYFCRLMNNLHFKHSVFLDERAVYRHLKRKYNHLSIEYKHIDNEQSKVIWIFWAQGLQNMPTKVRCCYESVLKNKGDNEVILLDQNNYSKYVKLPTYIIQKRECGAISWTHFSDILRFALLEKYGGWWIDATVYTTNTIPTPNKIFTIRSNTKNGSIADGNWCGFLWYLPKGYPLSIYVSKFLNEYWATNETLIAYLLLDHIIRIFYKKNKDFNKDINDIKPSCPDLFFFQEDSCEKKFNQNEWDKLKHRNLFFKTNWRTVLSHQIPSGDKTFYGFLFDK